MSVINQMLKDLDSRKGGDHLPQPDFSQPASGAGKWLVALVVLAAVAAAAWWYWGNSQTEQEVAQPPQVEAKQAVVAEPQISKQPEPEFVKPEVIKPEPQLIAKAQPEPVIETPDAQPIAQVEETPPEPSAPPASFKPEPLPEPLPKPVAKAKIQLHKLSPQEVAEAELKLARKYSHEGKMDRAQSAYLNSLRAKPGQLEARAELAQIYLNHNKLLLAWQQASLGLKFHPQAPELLQIKAQSLYQQGKLQGAWQTLSPIDDGQYLNQDFLMLKAGLANRLGHYEAAYILYARLTDMSPQIGRWWFGRALSAEYLTRPDEAKICYQKALQTGELSSASVKYAQHRIKQLGAH